jgi:hypothetical protein
MSNLNSVIVKFDNSDYNYTTCVSLTATRESCEKYFINTWFNVGSFPIENMQKCTSILFAFNLKAVEQL